MGLGEKRRYFSSYILKKSMCNIQSAVGQFTMNNANTTKTLLIGHKYILVFGSHATPVHIVIDTLLMQKNMNVLIQKQ